MTLAVCSFLIVFGISFTRFYQDVELKTLDLRFRLRPPIPVDDRILMVDIDETSLAKYGRWPWSRLTIARLVERLTLYGADRVFFDIEFLESSRLTVPTGWSSGKMQALAGRYEQSLVGIVGNAIGLIEDGHRLDTIAAELIGEDGIIAQESDELINALVGSVIHPDRILARACLEAGLVYVGYLLETHHHDVSLGITEDELMAALDLLRQDLDVSLDDFVSRNDAAASRGWDAEKTRAIWVRAMNMVLLEEIKHHVGNVSWDSIDGGGSSGAGTGSADERYDFLDTNLQVVVDNVVKALPTDRPYWFRPRVEKLVSRVLGELIVARNFSLPLSSLKNKFTPRVMSTVLPPIPGLVQAVWGTGFLNTGPDQDGTFRRVPLLMTVDDRVYPLSSFLLSLDVLGAGLDSLEFEDEQTMVVKLPGGRNLTVPLDRDGNMMVNWPGTFESSFEHIAASLLLTEDDLIKSIDDWLLTADKLLNVGFADLLARGATGAELAEARNLVKEELEGFSRMLGRQLETSTRLKDNPDLREQAAAKLKQVETLSDELTRLEKEKNSLAERLKENIGGKTCFVGLTASGTIDLGVTPFQEDYPMVGTHATLLSSFLTGNFVCETSQLWAFAAALLFALLMGIILPRFGYKAGTALTLIIIAGYVFGVYFLFSATGWLVEMVSPVLTVFLCFTSITVHRYRSEESQKRFIKDAFAHYLAPAVIEQLIDKPGNLKLGGEERVLTAFFSDVAGFSSISEKLTPTELVALLNEYLTAMTDIILQHGGTVDKYEGDAIIAFYGAPVPFSDHAARACVASLRQHQKLASMREHWASLEKPQLTARMGLCTGSMVVGNMGSRTRMDYTIMGDSVNLASRLEGANKKYGTPIMVAESTYLEAKDIVEARLTDVLRVVGRATPVRVYELLAVKGELESGAEKWLARYNEARAYYGNRRFEESLKAFQDVLRMHPEDPLSKVYVNRCEQLIKEPPPSDWDGVTNLTSK